MRFAIAVGILANTLPAASVPEKRFLLARAKRKERIKNLLTAEPNNVVGGIAGNKKKNGPGAAFFSHNAKSGQAVLKNEILQENLVECDPTSSNADVGILACGMGKYCVESSDYDLGGVCVDSAEVDFQRQLQYGNYLSDLCNEASENFGDYDCNCDEFDLVSGLGSVECKIYEVYNSCLGETCFSYSRDAVFYKYGDSNYTSTICYNFSTPYNQNVCYSTASLGGCVISFNDVTCNACVEYTNENFPDSTCREFDCSNTAGNHSGSDCAGDSVILIFGDLYSALYEPAGTPEPTETPPFICPICGEDKEVTLPDGVVSISTLPSFNCTELEGAAAAGNISLVLCAALIPFVATPCGCMDVDTPSPTLAPVELSEPDLPPTLAPVVPSTPAPVVIETPPEPAAPSGAIRNGAMALVGLSAAMMAYFGL
jgi:hypothetical protein